MKVQSRLLCRHLVKNLCKNRSRGYNFGVDMKCFRLFSSSPPVQPRTNELLHYLRTKIAATGPITVAEYMKEVLTNPLSGYYMQKDVFGSAGDFITSPEISQMFGELIAVWFLNEWSKVGQPKPVQLVELGPGRGTLADDILRVLFKFCDIKEALSLHLVEVSPHLCHLQKLKLCDQIMVQEPSRDDLALQIEHSKQMGEKLTTKYGIPVTWYQDLNNVSKEFSFFLAHEFFDALPIHKFQKTSKGWREILIDCKGGPHDIQLQYIISRGPTPASKLFIDPQETKDHIEISPESGILVQHLATRMKEEGGFSLIIDYGHDGTKSDTFRSFLKHKLHDPLSDPGTADLTADVDFSYLKKCVQDKALIFGPISQAEFLKNMAIEIRLQKLLQTANEEAQVSLQSGYDMLVSPDKMGERYKFFCLTPLVLKDVLDKFPPAGFS